MQSLPKKEQTQTEEMERNMNEGSVATTISRATLLVRRRVGLIQEEG
jgi:hypothetical protein